MQKSLKGLLACIVLLVFMTSLLPMAAFAAGNVYYVATDGSDLSDGTSLDTPFETIMHAANVMQPGDICYIRGGTYNEEINLSGLRGTASAGYSFLAYHNEEVVVSGGEKITGWEPYSGNIYVADASYNVYDGAGNLVFVDGELATMARWPNANPSTWLNRSVYARATGPALGSNDSNNIILTDTALKTKFTANDLVGARVWCASQEAYRAYTSEITAFNASTGQLSLDSNSFHAGYEPRKGNMYYLYDSLALLDAENEWYLDTENDKLYFYAPGGVDPDTLTVELRAREYAIDVKNSSYVTFSGIDVYGALVRFDTTANNCGFYDARLSALDARSYTAYDGVNRGYGGGTGRGIVINGTNNIISRCEIENSYGAAITVGGSSNKVVNNYIHDVGFEMGTGSNAIQLSGSNNLITRNTVINTAKPALGGAFKSCIISYNDFSETSKLTSDTGIIYLAANNFENSEIHHNKLHGNDLTEESGLQLGLYLDSFSSGLMIYNNVIYDTELPTPDGDRKRGMCLNPNSLGNFYANNTFYNAFPCVNWEGQDLSGTTFVNNLFRSSAFLHDRVPDETNGGLFTNNLTGSITVESDDKTILAFNPKDFWNDAANDDYTFKAGSEAIDAGIYVPGVTENYLGSAPDCGAFEYGMEPWTAGHDFSKGFDDTFSLNTKLPFRNMVTNNGFTGRPSAFGTVSGSPSYITSDSWGTVAGYTIDGNYALTLPNEGDGVTQTITGLKPYTTYTFGMYGFVGSAPVRYIYDRENNHAQTKHSLVTGETFYIDEADFGDGSYDGLWIRIGNAKANTSVELLLDSEDGEVFATIPLVAESELVRLFKWYHADIPENITGVHKVYLRPVGTVTGSSFVGFQLDDSDANDSVKLTATSDSDASKTLSFTGRYYNRPMMTDTIMTGADGTITLNIAKHGSKLWGYADFVYLAETPAAITGTAVADITAILGDVTDAEGKLVYGVARGKRHNVEATISNTSTKTRELTVTLVSYNGDEVAATSAAVNLNLAANQTQEINCSVNTPLADNVSLKLVIMDSDGDGTELAITDGILEAQYTGDGVIKKDAVVRNIEGDIVTNMTAGGFQIFEVAMKNLKPTMSSMLGVLAVYDNQNILQEVLTVDYHLKAGQKGSFGLGTVLPQNTGEVKLFAWDNTDDLQPVFENEVFRVAGID